VDAAALMAPLLHLLEVVRPADVVDVLVVATLVYPAVVWVRRTQAGLVAAGLLILAALYVGAQLFDLRLTTWLLRGFFAIILVVIVVIFQEEFRQLFERLALWSLRRGSLGVMLGTSPHDVLVQALSELARERVGALVILPGTQPIERHVRGGIELGGKLSVPLVRSIFDPHSPGHDGAAVVRDDRISRFAAHLPLSTDLAQLGGLGTRHAAALGLSELTDAICLVVSEERGEISIAEDGHLRRRVEPPELRSLLADFARRLAPEAKRESLWDSLVRAHSLEKVVTLVVVATLWWTLVPGARSVERTFNVPVRVVDLPASLELKGMEPPAVEITLAGLSREFYLTGSRNLAVTIDGSHLRPGRSRVEVDDKNLRYPKALEVLRVKPRTVRLVVEKRAEAAKAS
jgi:diadenylate cyclase